MKGYLIAFGGRPRGNFLPTLCHLASQDGVTIHGAVLTDGPGCYNLAILLDDSTPLRFVEALTMALMPAKYELCQDPHLQEGVFHEVKADQ